MGAPDATATLEQESAALFQLPSWCRGQSWEREEMPIRAPRAEPLSVPGSGAKLGKRGHWHSTGLGAALPDTAGHLPDRPSHQGPQVVPGGLPCPGGEKDGG